MNDPNVQIGNRALLASAISAVLLLAVGSGQAVAKPAGHHHQQTNQQETVISDQQTVSDKAGWNDPELAAKASHQGRMLLRQVKDVQTALKVGDTDGARHALQAAQDFAQTLKPLMPYQVISDKVRDANDDLLASDADVAVDQMLPIYGDVTAFTAFAPDQPASAKATAKDKQQAKSDEDMDVVATDVSTDVVYLPVLYFENQAELASKALDQDPPDTAAATQAVNDALSSLVFSETNVHLLPDDTAAADS